jgi:ribonucleoside-diphosphate reductase alpha chain
VVEVNGLPLQKQRDELTRKRRHGMGFIGLGSVCAMMQMAYGSEKAVALTDQISMALAIEGFKETLSLAKEKGAAPIMDETFKVTGDMLRKRPEMVADGFEIGDEVEGKVLWAKYSRYMQKIAKVNPKLIADLAKVGGRYTHATSIAPTGTISLTVGNNASNGIEPSFSHHYSRNVIMEGKKTKEKMDVFSYELLAYRELINKEAMPFSDDPALALPEYFVTTDDLSPSDHVAMQAAAQKWVDSSISKTINVATDIAFSDFESVYREAYDSGLKGCTTFRFNPEAFQGVLVTEKDLENTEYTFTCEDGSVVTLKGNEEVEYDGEMHSAANLFDALKEGTYGKY